MLHKVVDSHQKKKDAYQVIPTFSLINLEEKNITDKDLEKGKPVLFYFFDPECELCRLAFSSIKESLLELSDKQMVFFTIQPSDSIFAYFKQIDFSPPENMQILIDENAVLVSLMDIKGAPSSLIYDKHGCLIKRFTGLVKTETLIRYLSKEYNGYNSF
jgi:thiol-disulfide isomerase/thioredoxin